MSMNCGMVGVTPAQIEALRATPQLANDLAWAADDQASTASRKAMIALLAPDKRSEALSRFDAMERNPDFQAGRDQIVKARERLAPLGSIEPALQLRKSWHVLHYAITGNAWPSGSAGDALLTGDDLGDDMGYGPPRLHGPIATRAFADFISPLEFHELQTRIRYREMLDLGIYSMPMGGGSEEQFETELRTEVASYFPALREYVTLMSSKGNGLLVWLT